MMHPGRIATVLADEHGAVLIIFAVFAPVAVLLAAFAIDASNWFLHDRHLQVQADAGALAAAQQFQGCFTNATKANEEIKAAAEQYSGLGEGAYNKQLGQTLSENVHEQFNKQKYFNSPTNPAPDDPSAVEQPPCEAGMVDLKVTETNLPWYWHPLSSVSYLNAHARVEILQQATASGVEPLAIAQTAPVAAKVYFVDEDNKNAVLAQAPLEKTGVNSEGQDVWSNPSTPAELTINRPHIGVVIVLSGKASDTTCGHEYVECFGRKSGTERPTVENAEPALHIAGFSTSGTGTGEKPLPREVVLAAATCTDGYLSTASASCSFTVSAKLDWGSTNTTGVSLSAEVAGKKTGLSYNSSTGVWSGSATLPAGSGSNEVSLVYECKKVTGSPCQAAAVKTTFKDVHRIFAGSTPRSGSITGAWIGAVGGLPQDADSFPECSTCKQKLVATVDVSGSLSDASGFNDPLRHLKFEGNNVIIECRPGENPSASALRKHLDEGCPYHYKVNTEDPTCTAVGEPYDCVAVGTPGKKNGAASGIEDRIMNKPPVGTRFYCPSNWVNNNSGGVPLLPRDDSRIVQTFILPYGSLNENGESNLPENAAPIQDFAAFYVTGFVGDEHKCIEKGDPKTEGSFEILGHFIKYINLVAEEGGGKPKCREDPLGECVAVLTR